MQRRHFLQAATSLAPVVGASAANAPANPAATMSTAPFEWAEATVAELASAMASGRTSSAALVAAYNARMDAIDSAGPALRSVLARNPDAPAIAAQRDAERAAGRLRGPLHGIPVLVKDNIATADRMATTAGSPALLGALAPHDSTVVARLRAAGAVLLGKTNLSEWANFRGQHSSSGWSTLGGQTRNPYALDRSPSGSSSGTGAAIAANLGALGVGTETDGSITSPASVCGLVGFKPTVGLASRHGIVPIAFSQDTPGPMCRTVADAALLMAVLAGADERDPLTRTQRGRIDLATLAQPRPGALKGARLGVARHLADGAPREVAQLFEQALATLSTAGAVLVETQIPNVDKYGASELEVLLCEMKPAMADYLAEFAPNLPHRTLADLVAFNRDHPETLALFGQEWFEQSAAKGPLSSPAYRNALANGRRFARAQGIDAALKKDRLQALVAPTGGPAGLTDQLLGEASGPSASSPAAVAGYPHLTVPMGQLRGLPVGLSFIGTAWSDAQLLALGLHYEQLSQARRPPAFIVNSALG